MRQVFTSPRLANVEAVARMLEEAGIAITITNGRSYKGKFDRGMSYRGDGGDNQAAVWVTRSEDQPQARQLLRDAGLLDSTRPDQQRDSFLPEHLRTGATGTLAAARWLSPGRLKALLLVAIAAVIGFAALWQRRPAPTVQPEANMGDARGPVVTPLRTVTPVVQRVDVPSALAVLLLERIAGERGIERACVRIDQAAPSPRVLELLDAARRVPLPAPAAECGEDGRLPRIDIGDYRTDGSGTGRVRLQLRDGPLRIDQRYEVAREGHAWRVTGSSRP